MKFKLGKKKPRLDSRTFKLKRYLTALPPLPVAVDWSGNVPSWGMMLNDSLGDCTCAAAGHMEMAWTANTSGEFTPQDNDILAAYEVVGGYTPGNPATDNGADELTVLNYWRNTGIAGHKILAYASVEPTNRSEVQSAIALFGGAYIGVVLPQSAMDATNAGQPWTQTGDTNILGGHAIPLLAYDQTGLTCITWGQVQKMSWGWFTAYCDEAYAVFSQDWMGVNGLAPNGFDSTALQADLAAL